jgi:CDGSH-type Zn-finger protein
MPTTIKPSPNGPLQVSGDFKIVKADGTEIAHQGDTAYLCRCGHSSKKPFCDGSHKAAGFTAE